MKLSYRGAPFHGWQIQPGDISVQAIIEDALERILGQKTPVTGAGRTDAGVNARMMIAHFDSDVLSEKDATLIRSINALVGKDIAIESIVKVHDSAHARFDADSRTYRYYVSMVKSPFLYPLSWKCTPDIDVAKMNEAARYLLSVEDFASFAKLHSDAKTTICKVAYAEWRRWENFGIVFEITADRFLRNMVRAIVGTLIDVGRGKISVDEFKEIISAKDRCKAGTSMPAEALFLWRVTYPYFDSEKSIYQSNIN